MRRLLALDGSRLAHEDGLTTLKHFPDLVFNKPLVQHEVYVTFYHSMASFT
jgi:hypothetical protein